MGQVYVGPNSSNNGGFFFAGVDRQVVVAGWHEKVVDGNASSAIGNEGVRANGTEEARVEPIGDHVDSKILADDGDHIDDSNYPSLNDHNSTRP